MDLPRGLSAWLDFLRRVLDESAGQDLSNGKGLHLTFSIGVVRTANASELHRRPAAEEELPKSGDPVGTDRSQPPQPRDEDQPPAVSLHRPEHQEIPARPERVPEIPAASFWDVLDPIEREGLRAMASLRTFAAGATIMAEGDRADYVMVILGGQVKICIHENGTERVLAVRGLGQLVGERGALEVSVRSATVIALDMIWALVVQTKDFAAFLSTHPRVLDIIQNQVDQRRAQVTAGPGPSAAGKTARGLAADYPRRDPRRLNGENCTVFLTDVVGFGALTRTTPTAD
jgi:CRP-like cAMP-binding protein